MLYTKINAEICTAVWLCVCYCRLERALQLQPRNGELLLVKGVALWEMGDRASRVQAYSTLVVVRM